MQPWKKILLRAAGFGGAFAIIAAIIIGTFLWWSSRPAKPKQWDEKAIVTSYDGLRTEGESNTFVFDYTLENKTDEDYRVDNDSQVHMAAFLKRSQALSFSDTKNLHTDFPIYIPAKSRVRVLIHLGYPYPIKPNYDASDDMQHDFNTRVAQYVTNEVSNIDGFVLLDDQTHYKIMMPNGWAERAKLPMKVKPSDNSK